jgi:hypothetical protein
MRLLIAACLSRFCSLETVMAYCSEPTAPSCATRFGEFDDQDDFDQCKRKMTYFKIEVETYLSCIGDEAARIRNDYNSAVERFNRRARG